MNKLDHVGPVGFAPFSADWLKGEQGSHAVEWRVRKWKLWMLFLYFLLCLVICKSIYDIKYYKYIFFSFILLKKASCFQDGSSFTCSKCFDILRPLKEIVVRRGIRELVLWSNWGIPAHLLGWALSLDGPLTHLSIRV